jgi:multisubunit Na+/H+ antiporter MnhE subunit
VRLALRHWRFWLVWLGLGFGFYLLLSGTFSTAEILAGLAAAALGATAATLLRGQREVRISSDRAMLRELRWIPWRALTDSVEIYARLLKGLARARPLGGRVRAVPFDPGGDDARSQSRRALTDYFVSFTPMSIALGIDREARLVVVHELLPPGEPHREIGLDL